VGDSKREILHDIPINTVTPYDNNYLDHTNNLEHIKNSLKDFDYNKSSIVVDENNVLICGHGTLQAMKLLNWQTIPFMVKISGWDDETKKAYRIADNTSAQGAEIIKDKLNLELKEITLDMSKYGLDYVLPDPSKHEIEDEVPEVKETDIKIGDIYQIGDHRLMCGDCTIKENVDLLMDGHKADMVFTSPPYNCGIKYNSYDDLKEKEDYLIFISKVIKNCFDFMNNGRAIFWNCGSSPKSHAHAHAIEQNGFTMLRQIIWKKTGCQIPLWQHTKKNPVSRNYLPNYTHENIFLASKEKLEHGIKTEHNDKLANDVWEISQFSAGGKGHPAAFPIELVELPILSMTNENENLFEPFGGSGSTLIACEKTNRKCFMMEIDPLYCQVIIDRYKKYTGREDVVKLNG